jgi:hypothetical protein
MTEAPRDPNTPPPLPPEAQTDATPPVVLQEPRPEPETFQQAQRWTHEPAPAPAPPVDKAWAGRIPPGETELWRGAPNPRGARSGLKADLPMWIFIGVAVFIAAQGGSGPGLFVPLAMAGFVFYKMQRRRKGDRKSLSTSYLLTDRAAYIRRGSAIERHEITPHLRLALAPKGVMFAVQTIAGRDDERDLPYGFDALDPAEAETVYSMMLDLKKGIR